MKDKEDKKIIIALVGPFKGGKTTAADYLKRKHGAVNLRFSEFLAEILKKCYFLDPKDRGNLQKISTALREEFGDDFLGKIVEGFVRQSKDFIFVLDGVRRIGDIEYLKNLPSFILVSIDANPEVRYQRMIKQNEKAGDAQKTFAEFLAEEKQEADSQIRAVMTKADFIIDTTHLTEEEHLQRWDKMMSYKLNK